MSLLRDLDIILMLGKLCLCMALGLCTSRGLSAERSTVGPLLLFKVASLPRRTSEGVGWLLKVAPIAILRAGNSAASAA